jgi:polyisoprenoid-binding protein YceI
MAQMNAMKTAAPHRVDPVEDEQQGIRKMAGRKGLWLIATAAIFTIGMVTAGVAYVWFSGGSGQPSQMTAAPALILQPDDTRTLFHIAASESEVRFLIDETLLGNPKTVVGVTDEVAGDLLVDFEQPANSQLGTIRINVRTLETDNEFRTRALRGQILQADQAEFEFVEFTPLTLSGLPDTVAVGDSFEFQISGSLTIHGVTREVTFDAMLTVMSAAQLEGSASTVVLYRDFGMTIPEAPGVANVADEVRLEIDFTATASEG